MHLSAGEIARLRPRHQPRRRLVLRTAFAEGEGPGAEREAYFDAWILSAVALENLRDDDVLRLLELGYRQQMPLPETAEYTTCMLRRGWYGRRRWLLGRLERAGIDLEAVPAPLERY